MTIIEAIQQAENGKLITNGFWKKIHRNCFLKYMGNGLFSCYGISHNEKSFYKFEVRDFSMAEVISTDWEVVENKYFNQ